MDSSDQNLLAYNRRTTICCSIPQSMDSLESESQSNCEI